VRLSCDILEVQTGDAVRFILCTYCMMWLLQTEGIFDHSIGTYRNKLHGSSKSQSCGYLRQSKCAVSLRNIKFNHSFCYIDKIILLSLHSLNQRDFQIEFMWVKSHQGVFGNEIVDNRAKVACKGRITPMNNVYTDVFHKHLRNEKMDR
ncbi:hypothetical protein WA026_001302, partial [Henosepilachna vigintioctopunctata]